MRFECKAEKSFIPLPEAHLRPTDKTQILYFVVFVRAKIAFHTSKRLASTEFFFAMRKYVCGEHIKHMWLFSNDHESQLRYAHNGRSVICILRLPSRSSFIRISNQIWHCHCRIGSPLFTKQLRECKYVSNFEPLFLTL